MVCLFTGLFFLWRWLANWTTLRQGLIQLRRFIVSSLLAGGIAAVTLLPTWYALSLSKTKYTQTDWSAKFEYFPTKMVAKFFLGSFNFNQMPKGTPNLFIGSIAILGALLFFMQKKATPSDALVGGWRHVNFGTIAMFWTVGLTLARHAISNLVPLPILFCRKFLVDLVGGQHTSTRFFTKTLANWHHYLDCWYGHRLRLVRSQTI